MIQPKLGSYVVFCNIVCKVHSIWNDGESYDLTRVHPYTGEIFRHVRPGQLVLWDGLLNTQP